MMWSFVFYLIVVHCFQDSRILTFTISHTMNRLEYVEERLNAESKMRKDDFNALFKQLKNMESLLHTALERKNDTNNSVNAENVQRQLPPISDDKIKAILNAFKAEKIENHRFRREILKDMKKLESTIKAQERIEQGLNDIVNLVELLKEELKHHEITQGTKDVRPNATQVLPKDTVESSTKYASCLELYRKGFKENGVYEVSVEGLQEKVVSVFCDMTTDNGGWTVFQRRQDGSEDFYREWIDYKDGFGALKGEFWLGNEYINLLTDDGETHELRVDMEDYSRNRAYAKYSHFKVHPESTNYKLEASGYTGGAGDSLNSGGSDYIHNGMPFSTKDKDNDNYNGKCAEHANGAWWYNSCFASNLNGLYIKQSSCSSVKKCIAWSSWGGYSKNLKFTEMKFR